MNATSSSGRGLVTFVAWPLVTLAVGATVAGLLAAAGSGAGNLADLLRTPDATVAITLGICGAFLVGYQPSNRIGWLLLLAGVASGLYTGAQGLVFESATRISLENVSGKIAAVIAQSVWWLSYSSLLTLLPLLFPDGQPLPGRWRWVVLGAGLAIGAGFAGLAFGPLEPVEIAGTTYQATNPVGWLSPGQRDAVLIFGAAGLVTGTLLGTAHLVVRYRRGDQVVRRQIGWLLYPIILAVIASQTDLTVFRHISVALISIGIFVAVTRYRLYEIDVIVNKTVVGAVLLVVLGMVYAGAVGVVGAIGTSSGWIPSFVASAAVAASFHPVYVKGQRWVDRVLHRDRDDPYLMLERIGDHLSRATSTNAAVADIAATIRDGLGLPDVRIRIEGSHLIAQQPEDTQTQYHEIPLEWQGEAVGCLSIALRPRSTALDPIDERLLAVLAGPLGGILSALRLSTEVERTREDVVRAREAERRRLRRDIHDGLGPQLASIAHRLDAALRLIQHDPAKSRELLAAASRTTHDSVIEVRRLVQGLRPPALDELGLEGALAAVTTGLLASSPTLDVEIVVEDEMPPLPAAVEVAAFLIAREAVTNAICHSQAGHIAVTIRPGPPLLIEVVDDGVGFSLTRPGGVGLQSMEERAVELGGTLEIMSEAGTRVRALIPWADET